MRALFRAAKLSMAPTRLRMLVQQKGSLSTKARAGSTTVCLFGRAEQRANRHPPRPIGPIEPRPKGAAFGRKPKLTHHQHKRSPSRRDHSVHCQIAQHAPLDDPAAMIAPRGGSTLTSAGLIVGGGSPYGFPKIYMPHRTKRHRAAQ
jgi:hypothetical protein